MSLGVVGASGLVGKEILNSLNMLNIQFDKLFLYGNSTCGDKINFRKTEYIVMQFDNKYLFDLDYVILAVENSVAASIIEYAKEFKCKCIIIDNSSEYRLCKTVPLVIPEINISDINDEKIIANPNCSTTILVMLLAPLMKIPSSNMKRITLSTYQAASGAGIKGYSELITQTAEISSGIELTKTYWGKQYVHNIFSHNSKINRETLFNEEEMKIVNETKKILKTDIKISPTCVRVPTLRSHCLSVNIEFDRDIDISEIMKQLLLFEGIVICDDIDNNDFPEPIKTNDKTEISIGRIRHDIEDKSRWNFFIAGDQLLKGAAYNSVQILNYFINLKK